MTENVTTLAWLSVALATIATLFVAVIRNNAKGGRMHSRRMDNQAERKRFMNDWGPNADAKQGASGPGVAMDGIEFARCMRILKQQLERGEIAQKEFDRASRELTQRAWDDK
ncbi:MAG: hypothetical protein V3573_03170 [Desulfovibrionaceae bacterium]